MSSFTDDELHVLKAMTRAADFPLSSKQLRPLVARLEAAEWALLKFKIIPLEMQTLGMREALKKWREAAGYELH